MRGRPHGSTGAERTTGAAVRARLATRAAPADLGERALALDRRRRRVRGGTACAALLAVAALGAAGLLVPPDGADDAGTTPGTAVAAAGTAAAGAPGGPAAAVLLLEDVRALVPGADQSAPPADVSGAGAPGGWCRDLPLEGTGSPVSAWAAEWSRQAPAGTTEGGDVDGAGSAGSTRSSQGSVREEVMLWPGAAEAAAYTRAVRASPTTCRDPRGDAFPPTTWSPQAVGDRAGDAGAAAGDPRDPVLSVAAAPAGTSVPGTPTWRVRAVSARGPAAVSLTTVVRAADAAVAARATADLLDVALARAAAAAGAGADGAGSPGRPAGERVSVRGSADETGLGALSMLDAGQVSAVAPDLRAQAPPARLSPPTAGPGVLVGGWCSGPLRDVPLPDSVWFARWAPPEARDLGSADAPPVAAGVEETVLRFASPDGASAYAAATRRSSDRCPLRLGSRPYVVRPDRAGSPGRTVAVGPGLVDGSWSVRAVDARGTTVVVLSLLVPAADADAAAARGQDLADVALARAAGQGP